MTARELIQKFVNKVQVDSEIEESNVEIKVMGDSKEAKVKFYFPLEGKLQEFEGNIRFVRLLDAE